MTMGQGGHGAHGDAGLGMNSDIPRYDIVDGKASLIRRPLPLAGMDAGADDPGYPPALTGMRGSGVPRAYLNGHALREGWLMDALPKAAVDPQHYDLVVVGGGISGLAAAYFFQKRWGKDKKVLILDNHDDFGGHAKRNEFTIGGDTRLSNAGSFNIYEPGTDAERELFADIGVDVGALARDNVDTGFYFRQGMGQSVFFDRENFGADTLLKDPAPWTDFVFLYSPNVPPDADARWAAFMRDAPLPEAVRQDIYRLYHDRVDYLLGLTVEQKVEKLTYMSYADFVTQVAKCDPMVVTYLRDRVFGSGRGLDATTALAGYMRNLPGLDGMNLPPRRERAARYHFPEGNATIARLLVRKLVPQALPGNSVADSMTQRVDYSKLDRPSNTARIRLNSTVVNVRNVTRAGQDGGQDGVDIVYMTDDQVHRVKADRCVLACWFHVIPYLCPDMPLEQREALHYNVHVPNLWVNVWLRNWEAFKRAGACLINAPMGYYASLALEFPVSVGDHKHSQSPEQPTKLSMLRGYGSPGLHIKDQFRLGRIEMYETTFETYEREARKQLQATLGPYGFDAARDIAGITVNRWGHGYSYWYSPLYDDFLKQGGEPPHLRARKRFGRITVANTDAGGTDTTALAISMASRAVDELRDE
jgi:spermidine dehydrogenase